MSVYNRDYMRDESPRFDGGSPRTWGLIPWLIVINTVVFFCTLLFAELDRYLAVTLPGLQNYYLWTPITCQFAHADVLHLLFNMVGLFFLGRFALGLFSSRQILLIYLWGGLFGVLLHLGFRMVVGGPVFLLGASGSVLAILAAVATKMPNQVLNLMLFFVLPIRIKLKQIAFFTLGINALLLLLSPFFVTVTSGGRTAYAAHLGGMLFGYLYVRFWAGKSPLKDRFKIRILKDGESAEKTRKPTEKASQKPLVGEDIDAILDKINEHGFQSLTDKEKKLLDRGSRKLNKRIDNER